MVEKLGFTQTRSSAGATDVAYGAELVNVSYEHDALDVRVTWLWLDPGGRPLARRSTRLIGVPASATFFVGGRIRVGAGARVGRLVTSATLRASRERQLFLPVAAAVRLRRDQLGRLRVTGALTNAYAKPLSADTIVYVVVFDGEGDIVGGGMETLANAARRTLAPGETTTFAVESLSPTPARRALFAGVSIDP